MTGEVAAPRRDLLAAVLDRIVPAESGFPSAGEAALSHVLRAAEGGDDAPLLTQGLRDIDRIANLTAGAGFERLSAALQDATLREVEAQHPAFFEALMTHTYHGYYSNPDVIRLLGLDPTPPHPRGHQLEPMDLRLVGQVRQRPPIYRDA